MDPRSTWERPTPAEILADVEEARVIAEGLAMQRDGRRWIAAGLVALAAAVALAGWWLSSSVAHLADVVALK